jgi:hypothetical protein
MNNTARDAAIILMYQSGSVLESCAQAYGLSRARIAQILQAHHIPRRTCWVREGRAKLRARGNDE